MKVPIEIDGIKLRVRAGTSVIKAAKLAGIEIPHFCYHENLSVAANCRMCLVEIERVPKPLPACATNVTADMVIRTNSEKAKAAQQSVMEFLLINHPLDCPICDQGGECQLQDLSVGYGLSNSRYEEPKRVVVEKNLGPLISTDMMRCIHCTRCVRFGQEIAGLMELGMISRGEHAEIMPFVEKTVDSELSGNMIDVCPVGALTSKPFRFTARTWELKSVEGISPHDCWGSNLRVQIKGRKVMRVLPRVNDSINECWISDRDRFSYEALNIADRAVGPQMKAPGARHIVPTDWMDALDYVVDRLRGVIRQHGPAQVGFLAKGNMTLEELYLLQKLGRGLGTNNLDTRLYQRDFSMDIAAGGKIPWFGMPISSIKDVRQVLLVGLNPGNEVPLFAHKLRQIKRFARAKIGSVGQVDITGQVGMDFSAVVQPSRMVGALALMLKACGGEERPELLKHAPELDERRMKVFVEGLLSDDKSAVWIGQQALFSPQYGLIRKLATAIADKTGSVLGIKNPGSNSIGAYLSGMVPSRGAMSKEALEKGINAREMIENPLKAYMLLGCEPDDCYDPMRFVEAMRNAEFTVSLSSYNKPSREYSHVLLPIAPFTETDGTYINTEGQPQSFPQAVPPLGNSRPAWKLICVLGKKFGLEGFDFESIGQIRKEIVSQGAEFTDLLDNSCDYSDLSSVLEKEKEVPDALERIFEVATYGTDPIVRRAESLQCTRRGKRSKMVAIHPEAARRLGFGQGDSVRIISGDVEMKAKINIDAMVAMNCVRIPIGVPGFGELGCTEKVGLLPAEPAAAVAGA